MPGASENIFPMKDCLTKEKIELLNKRELSGKGLFKALKHLEMCERCSAQIKLPDKKEILKRFEEEELLISPASQ